LFCNNLVFAEGGPAEDVKGMFPIVHYSKCML
jgi:hypothetical protein